MTHQQQSLLGPLASGDEIAREVRRRKKKDVYQTVTAVSPSVLAGKVKRLEADGWRIFRRNPKSTRMAKAKPLGEQLEDEIWCILAQMGFKEMSQGRDFTIDIQDGQPPRKIEVFAKDDETVIIVECVQLDTPGKKRMAPLIEEIQTTREDTYKAIRREYGRRAKLKVKHVIATRNVSWSAVDLARCKRARIAVLTDGELDYYRALVQHLKHAARYQYLAHMFTGEKIAGLTKEVVATRGKMGGETFYTFLIRPDELLKIAYVGHKASRDIEDLETYQRMLQPRRLKVIAQYINDGGKFPTNIVVNLKSSRRTGLRFDLLRRYGDEALGILHLPQVYASAWIIDGQHRLYGYAHARADGGFHQDSTALPVLAFENLVPEKEMNLFIDINSKQVKVSTGLLVELYADLHWHSPDPAEALQALHSRIASRLNSQATSPLHDRMVVTGKKKTNHRCLTQTSIRDGLRVAKLIGTLNKGRIVPGPLSTAGGSDYDENLRKALSVLSDCFGIFATELPNHWNLGDAKGGYLCTNNGLRAVCHVIKDIGDHIGEEEGTDLCMLNADETFEAIEPFLQVLVDYLKDASAQEIQAFRSIGSSLKAVRDQAYGLEVQINKRISTFRPRGLQKYLESRDEAGTAEAAGKVTKIHRWLFAYVIETLKDHYGTEDKAWWTSGIPLRIRQKCTNEWEAKNRKGTEESHLYLIDYKDICISNWSVVKDAISLGARDRENKKANTKWIVELNEVRKITAHPERGVLTTDQVTFVNECFEKVKAHFPDGLS